jgi:methionyl aminopeptidase
MRGRAQCSLLTMLLGLSMMRSATPAALYSSRLAPFTTRARHMCMAAGFAKKDTFRYTGRMRPGTRSPTRTVPGNIRRPDYAEDGQPKETGSWQIERKSAKDIEAMRIAGRVAREVLDAAGELVAPGVSTDAIDALVHEASIRRGAYPSPLNYHGYPKSCCTSVNEIICHGIPDSYLLRDGDIVNIDVTCYIGGYHGDCSETFLVGEVDEAGKQLCRVTYEAWQAAIAHCRLCTRTSAPLSKTMWSLTGTRA